MLAPTGTDTSSAIPISHAMPPPNKKRTRKGASIASLDQPVEQRSLSKSCAKSCIAVLHAVMQNKAACIFNTPVPMTISDYHTTISYPMDLGTIKKKVLQGSYPYAECFAADVRMCWANAWNFNAPRSLIYQNATLLSRIFENKFLEEGTLEEKISDYESSPAWLEKTEWFWKMSRKPLTVHEKRNLKKNIITLLEHNPAIIKPMVKIIKASESPTIEMQGEHLKVNLGALEAPTLRHLQTEVVKTAARCLVDLGASNLAMNRVDFHSETPGFNVSAA
eukprot:gb/GEZN01012498.1/.p1 GENE.gb/GEZN01012498.1/~~gb/GEZN01012498.1/.p1  ORF type:complete len:278 (-),score=23.69 gb/GEZN01012498.1/:209-1042(-)